MFVLVYTLNYYFIVYVLYWLYLSVEHWACTVSEIRYNRDSKTTKIYALLISHGTKKPYFLFTNVCSFRHLKFYFVFISCILSIIKQLFFFSLKESKSFWSIVVHQWNINSIRKRNERYFFHFLLFIFSFENDKIPILDNR